jgi:hypothetical protein
MARILDLICRQDARHRLVIALLAATVVSLSLRGRVRPSTDRDRDLGRLRLLCSFPRVADHSDNTRPQIAFAGQRAGRQPTGDFCFRRGGGLCGIVCGRVSDQC